MVILHASAILNCDGMHADPATITEQTRRLYAAMKNFDEKTAVDALEKHADPNGDEAITDEPRAPIFTAAQIYRELKTEAAEAADTTAQQRSLRHILLSLISHPLMAFDRTEKISLTDEKSCITQEIDASILTFLLVLCPEENFAIPLNILRHPNFNKNRISGFHPMDFAFYGAKSLPMIKFLTSNGFNTDSIDLRIPSACGAAGAKPAVAECIAFIEEERRAADAAERLKKRSSWCCCDWIRRMCC